MTLAPTSGRLPITLTHGMTVGELALMFSDLYLQPQQRVKITVVCHPLPPPNALY